MLFTSSVCSAMCLLLCISCAITYLQLDMSATSCHWIVNYHAMQAGKQPQARLLLQKGCESCPTSDDIWLEASRMQANPDSAKAVLARGVAALPNSIKLWLQARCGAGLGDSASFDLHMHPQNNTATPWQSAVSCWQLPCTGCPAGDG